MGSRVEGSWERGLAARHLRPLPVVVVVVVVVTVPLYCHSETNGTSHVDTKSPAESPSVSCEP